MTSNTATRVREHIISTFLFDDGDEMIPDHASLLGAGLIDSTGVLDLILFVEDEFGLSVDDEDVVPANFDSVDRLTAFIDTRLQARRPALKVKAEAV